MTNNKRGVEGLRGEEVMVDVEIESGTKDEKEKRYEINMRRESDLR